MMAAMTVALFAVRPFSLHTKLLLFYPEHGAPK